MSTWQSRTRTSFVHQTPSMAAIGTTDRAKTKHMLLTLGVLTLFWLLLHSIQPWTPDTNEYVLIIDAGSSGTRMYAYSWIPPVGDATLPTLTLIPPDQAPTKIPRRAMPSRRAYKRVETEPGLDSYANDVGGVETKALKPLIDWAEAVIPRSAWEKTPVFLLGTAGLRRLHIEDQEQVLIAARKYLASTGLRFQPSWARVLTGSDEGTYGWIALNLMAGTLDGDGSKTLGMLDLGGSSLEVAFVSEDPEAVGTHRNVTLLGANQRLFSHVHHHYGLNDAFDRTIALLVQQQQQQNDNDDSIPEEQQQQRVPSIQESELDGLVDAEGNTLEEDDDAQLEEAAAAGDDVGNNNKNRKRLVLLQSNTQQQQITVAHPCLHQGYAADHQIALIPSNPNDVTLIRVTGAPDYAQCRNLAIQVVNEGAADCSLAASSCALGAPQPHFDGKFVALTGFYVVHHFYDLATDSGFDQVDRAGQQFCAQPWSTVIETHKDELSVEQYCFRAPYITALIEEGLHLNLDSIKIGNADAGWTLGAALAEGSRQADLGQQQLKVTFAHYWHLAHLATGVFVAMSVSVSLLAAICTKTGPLVAALILRIRGDKGLPVSIAGASAATVLFAERQGGANGIIPVTPFTAAYDKKYTPATQRTLARTDQHDEAGTVPMTRSTASRSSQMFSRRLTTAFLENEST